MFLPLLLDAIFAATFILGGKATSFVPPLFYVGLRMIISGTLLLAYLACFTKEKLTIAKKHVGWFLGIIVFHIYFAFVLEYICYDYLPASYVALVYNISPFITALFAYLCLSERITKKQWLGILIGVGAMLPFALLQGAPTTARIQVGLLGSILAQFTAIMSVVATCGGWVFFKKVTVDLKYSCLFANGVGMIFGGILSYISSLCIETQPTLSTVLNPYFLILLGLSILIGNVIVYNMYGLLLKRYSTTLMSLSSCTIPLFAALYDWAWLGTPIGPLFIVTALITSVGIYIFYKDELRTKKSSSCDYLEEGR